MEKIEAHIEDYTQQLIALRQKLPGIHPDDRAQMNRSIEETLGVISALRRLKNVTPNE